MPGEGGLGLEKGRLVEEEHVLYDALLQEGVSQLFIGRMLGVGQKLFDAYMLVSQDDARGHASVRQGTYNPILHFPVETVGKGFKDKKGLLVDVDCRGNIGEAAELLDDYLLALEAGQVLAHNLANSLGLHLTNKYAWLLLLMSY